MKTRSRRAAILIVLGVPLAVWGLLVRDSGSGKTGAERAAPQEQTESTRLNAFFERTFQRDLDRSPQFQSYLGIKKDYGKWDDLSDTRAVENDALKHQDLADLAGFDYDRLDPAAQLSYRLFKYDLEQDIADFEFRFNSYPINQMFGAQSRIPAFLINIHRITSVEDATAYVSRLDGVSGVVDQIIAGLRHRAELGVTPPVFVFAHARDDIANVLKGAPFEHGGADSTLLADFRAKIAKLDIDDTMRMQLIDDAKAALKGSFEPSFRKLAEYLTELENTADGNKGVWALPDGARYYAHQLKRMTSTDLTADQIHQIGLHEVARIHTDMRAIMKQVGFAGDLQAFFAFMRDDDQFRFPQSATGRAAYLARAEEVIAAMKAKLDSAFAVKPQADLVVKAVEPFREKSAGKAFYQQPAPDGSRPGVFYVNLYDMADMPTHALESLAYHEGIPGHHMQRAIQIELKDMPKFRKFGGHTAYTEGWGLYAEYLGKEMGFYQDPYSDFGRLAAELWRACRLVVDTGIHHLKWTRAEAIDYLAANTPNGHGDIVKAIERYFVAPGQATAYKIGMRKILELRERAKQSLGEDFDIRDFHDIVLKNGPMPLAILEDVVDQWIEAKTS